MTLCLFKGQENKHYTVNRFSYIFFFTLHYRTSGEEENVQPSEEKATFTRNDENSQSLEVSCLCTPHLNVSICGLEIISDIKTLEFYSHRDGYLKTCKGRQLKTDNDDSEETTLYYCCLRLEDNVNDLVIKVSSIYVACFKGTELFAVYLQLYDLYTTFHAVLSTHWNFRLVVGQ